MKKTETEVDGISFGTQNPLKEFEIDNLLTHMLRCPGFLVEALANLQPNWFGLHRAGLLISRGCMNLIEKHGEAVTGRCFQRRLKQELWALTKNDPSGSDVEVVEGMLAKNGLVTQAFQTSPDELDIDDGRKLLGRMIVEKSVMLPIQIMTMNDVIPVKLEQFLGQLNERVRIAETVGGGVVTTLGDERAEHQAELAYFRGRELVGLKTGLLEFDRRTLGLRGIFVLVAKSGVGKTTLTLQLALGVCRHFAENDCVVIVVSLDMNRFDLYKRIDCNLAGMEWKTLMFGTKDKHLRAPGSMFSTQHAAQLAEAEQKLQELQIGKRLLVLDRAIVGDQLTVQSLAATVRRLKQKAAAKRALVIVDYVQLVPVPESVSKAGDLAADKYRVRFVQQVMEATRAKDDPMGDSAIIISEARKPPTSKDPWAHSTADIMGSARLGYCADAILLYQEMPDIRLPLYYPYAANNPSTVIEDLKERGIVPIMLSLEKGRDGMSRGSWGAEFHFTKSKFRELSQHLSIPAEDDDDAVASGHGGTAPGRPPLPPEGPGRQGKGKKAKAKAAVEGQQQTSSAAMPKTTMATSNGASPTKPGRLKPRCR